MCGLWQRKDVVRAGPCGSGRVTVNLLFRFVLFYSSVVALQLTSTCVFFVISDWRRCNFKCSASVKEPRVATGRCVSSLHCSTCVLSCAAHIVVRTSEDECREHKDSRAPAHESCLWTELMRSHYDSLTASSEVSYPLRAKFRTYLSYLKTKILLG